MAKANKCDRCGKFHEDSGKKQCEIVIFANKYVPTSYDLCDECYLELEKWLVEKKAKHV